MLNNHQMPIYAVIMAGGFGERFWPQSRSNRPKQFLKLISDTSLIRLTALRVLPIVGWERIIVVAQKDQEQLVRSEMPELLDKHLLLEPEGRNTAPCLALAAQCIGLQEENAVMIALPADHYIKDNEGFLNLLKLACQGALKHDALVTIGIVPDKPETGYGYIQYDISGQDKSIEGLHKVARFVEKPDYQTALRYVEEGSYLWNSGMIIFSVRAFMASLKSNMPALFKDVGGIQSVHDPEKLRDEIYNMYQKTEKISIDYGLLEKADNILVAKGDFGWDDIGSFASVDRHHDKDLMNNVSIGDTALLDCQDCTIVSEDGVVGAIGLRDIIVVRSGNAVIVLPKERAQDVKKIVAQIKKSGLGKDYL